MFLRKECQGCNLTFLLDTFSDWVSTHHTHSPITNGWSTELGESGNSIGFDPD